MYLEVYIGILAASAIVASLVTHIPTTASEKTTAGTIIFLYLVSALIATFGIMYNILSENELPIFFDKYLAFFTVAFFAAATAWLTLLANRIIQRSSG